MLILTAKHLTHDELKDLKRNNVYQIIQKGGIDRNSLLHAVSDMLAPPAPVVENTTPPPGKPKTVRAKPRLLIVEDNQDNRTTLRALLADRYDLIEAEDGEQGIALAKEKMPDLILMDIALPGINGIDAFHAIRKNSATQQIPIIALTASVMTNERSTIMSHGFDAFIAKPIVTDEMNKVIREVLYD